MLPQKEECTLASSGTIITHVYTSRAQIPVSGALVALLQPNPGGKATLLALRVTDESGRTAPVRLATPDLSQGTSPGGSVPYTLIDLWCEAPGYGYQIVEGIEIYPGVETIQDVELVPLSRPENIGSTNGNTTVITPPAL